MAVSGGERVLWMSSAVGLLVEGGGGVREGWQWKGAGGG